MPEKQHYVPNVQSYTTYTFSRSEVIAILAREVGVDPKGAVLLGVEDKYAGKAEKLVLRVEGVR